MRYLERVFNIELQGLLVNVSIIITLEKKKIKIL